MIALVLLKSTEPNFRNVSWESLGKVIQQKSQSSLLLSVLDISKLNCILPTAFKKQRISKRLSTVARKGRRETG